MAPDTAAPEPAQSQAHRVVRISVRNGIGRCSICGDYAESKDGAARHITHGEALANAGLCGVCRGTGQVGEMPADCPECGLNPIPGKTAERPA